MTDVVYTIEYGNADSEVEVLVRPFATYDEAHAEAVSKLEEAMDEYDFYEYGINTDDEIDDGIAVVVLVGRSSILSDGDELEWYRIREFMV